MEAVEVLHEPANMQQPVSEVEPGVKHEYVDEDLLYDLQQAELILLSCPVTVERRVLIDLPQPYSGE